MSDWLILIFVFGFILPTPTAQTRAQVRSKKAALSVVLLYSFLAFVGYWEFHIPSPGEAVATLGVAAGLLALLGEMTALERAAWTTLLFAFMQVEITAIGMERKTSDAERQAESLNFQRVLGKSDDLLLRSNKLISSSERLQGLMQHLPKGTTVEQVQGLLRQFWDSEHADAMQLSNADLRARVYALTVPLAKKATAAVNWYFVLDGQARRDPKADVEKQKRAAEWLSDPDNKKVFAELNYMFAIMELRLGKRSPEALEFQVTPRLLNFITEVEQDADALPKP